MKKEKKQPIPEVKDEQQVENVETATAQNIGTETEEVEDKKEECSDFVAKYEEALNKCNEMNDKNLRLMAEFDNYRKRTLKEKSELIKSAGENIFVEMLPLVDDFERAIHAMENSSDVTAVKTGIDLIYSKFTKFLVDHQVKEIPTIDETFDLDKHEAVSLIKTDDKSKKGVIVDCVSKGYTLNDKVIRYPKVIVGE